MLFKKSKLGLRLLKQALKTFREEKKLWFLPLIGRGFFFLILISISLMVWKIRSLATFPKLKVHDFLLIYLIVILALWLGNIVSAYFNTALMYGVTQYQQNQRVSLKTALNKAWQRFWAVFVMIFAHFTVGGFTLLFGNRFAATSRFTQLVSGLPWRFASFFIPSLMVDNPVNYFQNLRRSSQLMLQIAGDKPQFNLGYLWLSLFFRLISMIPISIGFYLQQNIWKISGTSLTFLLLLAFVVMLNGIHVVIHFAIYHYFAHGITLKNFQATDLAQSIGRREWED